MFAQGVEAFGMVEFFVGGLAGIDVGVPEFRGDKASWRVWALGSRRTEKQHKQTIRRRHGIFKHPITDKQVFP